MKNTARKNETSQERYTRKSHSFKNFLNTQNGRAWAGKERKRQDQIMREEVGHVTDAEEEQRYNDTVKELENTYICDSCFWMWEYDGEKKCPDCGSKKIKKCA